MEKNSRVKITEGALKKIKEIINEINDDMEEELKEIDYLIYRDSYYDINIDGDSCYIWLDEDMEEICQVDGLDSFSQIKELNIYITRDMQDGEYYYQGDIGDSFQFMEFYMHDEFADDQQKSFADSVNSISWYDEDNVLYKAVEKELKLLTEDEESQGEGFIVLSGNDIWGATVEDAIEKNEEYKDAEFEFEGYYSGKKIYRINNKLYYCIEESSYTMNTEYSFSLQEVGQNCYEYFR